MSAYESSSRDGLGESWLGGDIRQILQSLPHRYPFVLVDRVTALVPRHRICGHKCVSINEPWFQGHFPGFPVMPGVLLIEAMAQICGILADASEPLVLGERIVLGGIEKARFRRFVEPGDRLDLRAELAHHRERLWQFRAQATVQGQLRARCELTMMVVQDDIS